MRRALWAGTILVSTLAAGAGWAVAQDDPVVDFYGGCVTESNIRFVVTSDTDLEPGRLVFRGAQFIGGSLDEPVAGEGNPVQAGVEYPVTTSRHGESYLLLDGEVVVAQATDTDVPPCEPGPAVERISGANRYATAAATALRFYQGASVVYLANGESFPDALTAAGIPDREQGPVLLTAHDALPEETRAALEALAPRHLRVLGGAGAVSDAVLAEAAAAAGLTP